MQVQQHIEPEGNCSVLGFRGLADFRFVVVDFVAREIVDELRFPCDHIMVMQNLGVHLHGTRLAILSSRHQQVCD
jgi:hypothetical protein